jgi:hypothetical protein
MDDLFGAGAPYTKRQHVVYLHFWIEDGVEVLRYGAAA